MSVGENSEREARVQRWCPNCEHFFKRDGLNGCKLYDWSLHPIDGGDPAVKSWLDTHTDSSTRIHDDADNCPRFVPFAELAQKLWLQREGEKR